MPARTPPRRPATPGKNTSNTSRRRSRPHPRREEVAAQLILVGGLMAISPWFFDIGWIQPALDILAPFGWLAIAAGLVVAWLARREARSPGDAPPQEAAPPQPVAPAARPAASPRQSGPADVPATVASAAPAPAPTIADAITGTPGWSADLLSRIEWRRFEAVVEALFAQAGFQTRAQSHGADGGVDIWLHSRHQPDRAVSLVQCKHWHGRAVGVDKVRELRGVMAAHGVERGQFVTTAHFTPDAQAFAAGNGIRLLDGAGLLALIAQRSTEQQQALLDVALEGEYWRPTCASCGVKMVERAVRSSGKAFWGCVNYPRCRTTLEKRAAAADGAALASGAPA